MSKSRKRGIIPFGGQMQNFSNKYDRSTSQDLLIENVKKHFDLNITQVQKRHMFP